MVEYKNSIGLSKPLLLIEDIHSTLQGGALPTVIVQFLGVTLDLYNVGVLNVVFTVGDVSVVQLLESGMFSGLRDEL